jgi:hypothetical protein
MSAPDTNHGSNGRTPSAPPSDQTAGPPISGYDRLDMKKLIGDLRGRPQHELAAIAAYEESHANRNQVMEKLRYLRGPEPIENYDRLSVEEITAALMDGDLELSNRVRVYERRLRSRGPVLEAVARVRLDRHEEVSSRITEVRESRRGDVADWK